MDFDPVDFHLPAIEKIGIIWHCKRLIDLFMFFTLQDLIFLWDFFSVVDFETYIVLWHGTPIFLSLLFSILVLLIFYDISKTFNLLVVIIQFCIRLCHSEEFLIYYLVFTKVGTSPQRCGTVTLCEKLFSDLCRVVSHFIEY